MSCWIESMYSCSSLIGFVSSKRRWQRPPNSWAIPKFSAIDLGWPMWRYPFGSGGKRVTTSETLPARTSPATISRMKSLRSGVAGSSALTRLLLIISKTMCKGEGRRECAHARLRRERRSGKPRETAHRRTPVRASLALAERAAARTGAERVPEDALVGRVRRLASGPHGGRGRGDEGAVRVRLRRLPASAPHGVDRLPLPCRGVAAQGDRARGARAPAVPRPKERLSPGYARWSPDGAGCTLDPQMKGLRASR